METFTMAKSFWITRASNLPLFSRDAVVLTAKLHEAIAREEKVNAEPDPTVSIQLDKNELRMLHLD